MGLGLNICQKMLPFLGPLDKLIILSKENYGTSNNFLINYDSVTDLNEKDTIKLRTAFVK